MLRADELGSGRDDEPGPAVDRGGGTWVLQGEAAAQTGFSVSAVRKWRRLGLVADRKVATPNGSERVEVCLEDVLARAALQPDRGQAEGSEALDDVPSGSVVVGLHDLETLFERMVKAESRADRLEAELQSAKANARYTLGQLTEVRRQLDRARAPQASEVAGTGRPDTARTAPTAPSAYAQAGAPPRVTPRRVGVELDLAAGALCAAYARLDAYRREQTISPAKERRRQQDLADYDAALLAVCSLKGIPGAPPDGRPISVEERGALTKALAEAGLDVRSATGDPGRGTPRRAAARTRA